MQNNTEHVTLDLINGYRINAFPNDLITNEIIKHGMYEKTLFLFLKKLLRSNQGFNCLDIGANIGVVTLTLCRYANKVISFEPTPETFELLNSTIKENHIKNCIPCNIGLSNTKGNATFFVQTNGNIGSSSLSPYDRHKCQREISITLEIGDENHHIQALEKIDVIKIDVEGHEPQVLLGLKKSIIKNNPIIILEWDNDSTRNGFQEHQIFQTILADYSVFHLASKMSAFRKFTKKNKLTSPFRSILRLLYQLSRSKDYLESPTLLSDFDRKQCYSSIILIPNNRLEVIQLYNP